MSDYLSNKNIVVTFSKHIKEKLTCTSACYRDATKSIYNFFKTPLYSNILVSDLFRRVLEYSSC